MIDMQTVIIGFAVAVLVLILWKRRSINAWLQTFQITGGQVGIGQNRANVTRTGGSQSANQAAPVGPVVRQEAGGEGVIQESGITASKDSTGKVTQVAQEQGQIQKSPINTSKGYGGEVIQEARGKGKIESSGVTIK